VLEQFAELCLLLVKLGDLSTSLSKLIAGTGATESQLVLQMGDVVLALAAELSLGKTVRDALGVISVGGLGKKRLRAGRRTVLVPVTVLSSLIVGHGIWVTVRVNETRGLRKLNVHNMARKNRVKDGKSLLTPDQQGPKGMDDG
jgi:hypothetical protein